MSFNSWANSNYLVGGAKSTMMSKILKLSLS